MQRSAVGLLAIVWIVGGCTMTSNQVGLGPLPEPVLVTSRAARPVRAISRPRMSRPPAPRTTWHDSYSKSWLPPGRLKKGCWKTIIIHHSASPEATPKSMHNYHLKQRGWSNGLGYHFVIGNGRNYPDGQVHVGARWKKQLTGAHCKSKRGRYLNRWRADNYFNEHGVGICLIGNFEKDRPTRKQLDSLTRLLAFLCRETGISPDRIHGHGEVTHKTLCPGRYLNMKTVRRSVQSALGHRSLAAW